MLSTLSRFLHKPELLFGLLVTALSAGMGIAVARFGGGPTLGVLGLLIAAVIAVVAVYRQPAWGAGLILALAPFEGSLEIAGQSAVRLVTLLCVGVIAVNVLFNGKKLVFDQTVYWTLALVCWSFVTIVWSYDYEASLSEWISFALQSLLYFILLNLIFSLNGLKIALWGHVLGGLVFSVIFIYLMVTRDFLRNVDILGLGINLASRLIGLNLLMSMILYQLETNRFARAILLLPIASAAIGVVIAFSRGTWLGAAASVGIVGFVYVVKGKLRIRFGQAFSWALIIVVLVYITTTYILDTHGLLKLTDRFQSGVTLSDSAGGRFEIWKVAWNVFLDSPIWGHGFDTFPHQFIAYVEKTGVSNFFHVNESKQAHNAYVKLLGEVGLIGTILFLGILTGIFKRVWSIWNDRQANVSAIAWGLALFTFLLVATMVDSAVIRKYFWYSLGTISLLIQYWGVIAPAAAENTSEDAQ